ncbi:hypothetical protein GmHk_13G038031 [Glycine max]|nr:hypothetical protein GmHk_13G038031 [Glycine max]
MHFWDAMCIRIFDKTVKECRHEFIAVYSLTYTHRLNDIGGDKIKPSLSRSADYDPEKIVFVTPAKRMSGELDYDEYTQYELSTN